MKTKQGKVWLSAALSLAVAGTAIGGIAAMESKEVKADAATLAVGEFHAWQPYKFEGTQDGKTTISYSWAANNTDASCRVTVSNYTSGGLSLSFTSQNAATVQLTLTVKGDWTPYSIGKLIDETADAGKMVANTEFTYSCTDLKAQLTTEHQDKTTFDLVFRFDFSEATAKTNVITVNSLTVGETSYTPEAYAPRVEAPATAFKAQDQWTGNNCTVAAFDGLTDLTGDAATGAIDNGKAKITITDPAGFPTGFTNGKTDDNQVINAYVEVPFNFETSQAGWPTDWTNFYIKFKADNLSGINGYFDTINNCTECSAVTDGWNGYHGFAFDLISGAPSVSEGYKMKSAGLGIEASKLISSHTNKVFGKIILAFKVKDTTKAASIEIAGMTFGKTTPKFINDIGTPALAFGDWTGDVRYTIAQEGSITAGEETYEGLKVEYTTTNQYDNIYMPVSNFNATNTPKIHLGFYTDSDIAMCVNQNWDALKAWANYEKGYHTIDIDVSKLTEFVNLRLYFDSATALAEGAKKTIVFDSIVFHKDLEIALDDAASNAAFVTDLTPTDEGFSWSYDAKNAGAYYQVNVPVNNYYSFANRYCIIDVSLSHDLKLGVYFNTSGGGNFLQAHTLMKAGNYKLCFDTKGKATDNDLNKLWFYFDVENGSDVALVKTINVKSITFSNEKIISTPNASVVTIDYANRIVAFDDTKYQVAKDNKFLEADLIANGGAVVPGTKLYVREFEGTVYSEPVELDLPVTTLTLADAPKATITENSVRFTEQGYEYQLEGVDTEWKTIGSWGKLSAGTKYVVKIRKAATETSFASEVITLEVSTAGNAGCRSSIGGTLGLGLLVGCMAVAATTALVIKKRKED